MFGYNFGTKVVIIPEIRKSWKIKPKQINKYVLNIPKLYQRQRWNAKIS